MEHCDCVVTPLNFADRCARALARARPRPVSVTMETLTMRLLLCHMFLIALGLWLWLGRLVRENPRMQSGGSAARGRGKP